MVSHQHTRKLAQPGFAVLIAEQLQQFAGTMPDHVYTQMVTHQQTKALHVGTYESSIENTLRRMRDEADAHSQFYLHRVALNVAADAIDTPLRHESHDDASQLVLRDLGALIAVRYINVRESPGSMARLS